MDRTSADRVSTVLELKANYAAALAAAGGSVAQLSLQLQEELILSLGLKSTANIQMGTPYPNPTTGLLVVPFTLIGDSAMNNLLYDEGAPMDTASMMVTRLTQALLTPTSALQTSSLLRAPSGQVVPVSCVGSTTAAVCAQSNKRGIAWWLILLWSGGALLLLLLLAVVGWKYVEKKKKKAKEDEDDDVLKPIDLEGGGGGNNSTSNNLSNTAKPFSSFPPSPLLLPPPLTPPSSSSSSTTAAKAQFLTMKVPIASVANTDARPLSREQLMKAFVFPAPAPSLLLGLQLRKEQTRKLGNPSLPPSADVRDFLHSNNNSSSIGQEEREWNGKPSPSFHMTDRAPIQAVISTAAIKQKPMSSSVPSLPVLTSKSNNRSISLPSFPSLPSSSLPSSTPTNRASMPRKYDGSVPTLPSIFALSSASSNPHRSTHPSGFISPTARMKAISVQQREQNWNLKNGGVPFTPKHLLQMRLSQKRVEESSTASLFEREQQRGLTEEEENHVDADMVSPSSLPLPRRNNNMITVKKGFDIRKHGRSPSQLELEEEQMKNVLLNLLNEP